MKETHYRPGAVRYKNYHPVFVNNDFRIFFRRLRIQIILSHINSTSFYFIPAISFFDQVLFSKFFRLSALYECPLIWFSSADPHSLVLQLIDEVLNPAYNPGSISNNLPPFTFIQRVQELFGYIFFEFFKIL